MAILPILLALAANFQAGGFTDVPFRLADDAIIVDGSVNGRSVSCLFDTGFTGSIVLNNAIDIGKPNGSTTLRDFVGEFQATTVKIKSLKLGEKSLDSTGMEAVQQPIGNMSFGYNMHTDGIMGFELLRKNVTEINFKAKKFVFYPDSFDISTKKPDNKTTFLVKMLPIGHNAIVMDVSTGSGKKMFMTLDTGNAFYATTHKDVLERVGLWQTGKLPQYMESSGVASGAVDSFYKRMNDLVIFGVPVKTSVWSVIDLPSASAESDGTIGFGFLKNFNITFDYTRRWVWFERITDSVSNDELAEPGITAYWNPRTKRMQVVHVTPNSPADKAGIKESDQLLAIDGEDVGNFSYRRLRKLLQGSAGSKIGLDISRDGNLIRYDLTRQLLVND